MFMRYSACFESILCIYVTKCLKCFSLKHHRSVILSENPIADVVVSKKSTNNGGLAFAVKEPIRNCFGVNRLKIRILK